MESFKNSRGKQFCNHILVQHFKFYKFLRVNFRWGKIWLLALGLQVGLAFTADPVRAEGQVCALYLQQDTTQDWTAIWKNFARKTAAHPDFKYISDLIARPFTDQERRNLVSMAKTYRLNIFQKLLKQGVAPKKAMQLTQKAFSRQLLYHFYEFKTELNFVDPKVIGPTLHLVPPVGYNLPFSIQDLQGLQDGLEHMWPILVRKTAPRPGSSLLQVSEPILIAGGRFREGYYWDTYFGAEGLVASGRWKLAAAQLSNFVELINTYGLIPNGLRTYYLGRSQPPVVALLARLVYEGTRELEPKARQEIDHWLTHDVLPALKKDYENFWMKHRLDEKTGLNFYSDQFNLPRPERHSHDVEAELGQTYRDVRAEAESGQDHTELFQGQASQIASVSLNSFLYGYEQNLAWLSSMAGDFMSEQKYSKAANVRQTQMTKYLWNQNLGVFQNYHLGKSELMSGVSGDVFSTLFTGVATLDQARRLAPAALGMLELSGGIAASTLVASDKQWDGRFGWAPFQMMAIQGLDNYGFKADAQRIAKKWLGLNLKVFLKRGHFYEKLDLARMDIPIEDASKYPTQTGFLWTNGSLVWVLKYLGFRFSP